MHLAMESLADSKVILDRRQNVNNLFGTPIIITLDFASGPIKVTYLHFHDRTATC